MSYLRKIYEILPDFLKENVKEVYYNITKKEKFRRFKDGYITTINKDIQMRTKGPMYFLVKDIENYEQFYSIKEGDIVLDGGANEGYLSIYYAKKVKSKGRIFAFEPDKINIKAMKQNLKMNTNVDNIKIYKDLIWDKDTKIEFYEAGTVASSVFYEPKKSKKVLKNAITIDSFCKKLGLKKLDFIKMDIEGAEVEALMGATDTLKNLKPNFVIASYHVVNGEVTYKKVETFFRKNDYPYKTVFYEGGEILTFAGKCVE